MSLEGLTLQGRWNWLLGRASDDKAARHERSPAPVRFPAGRDRLPPRDEGFYSAWQHWSQ
ncbi:hypothetical protein C1D09_021540 [Mesorhizobium intechi]|uniref:Uncharacterized protein n=1 Tax=Mesorhizobium intechi TaxID=537601 RepID=A0A8T9ANX7_9HYPH|nr:hypothetical protein C1D09_021540 [Mesorhizobium intechi]